MVKWSGNILIAPVTADPDRIRSVKGTFDQCKVIGYPCVVIGMNMIIMVLNDQVVKTWIGVIIVNTLVGPAIKFYIGVKDKLEKVEDYDKTYARLETKIQAILDDLKL